MGLAQYAIVPVRNRWGVLHDGDVKGEYATKEAAFEVGRCRRIDGDASGPRGSRQRARTRRRHDGLIPV